MEGQEQTKASGDATAAALVAQGLREASGAKEPGTAAAGTEAHKTGDGEGQALETKAGEKKPGESITVTREELQKLIAEEVGKGMKGQQGENARSRFIIQNMAEMPEILHDLMPATTDTKALQERFSQLADGLNKYFQKHIEKLGLKMPNVGGAGRDGGLLPGKAPVDASKMSAQQMVSEGLAEQHR